MPVKTTYIEDKLQNVHEIISEAAAAPPEHDADEGMIQGSYRISRTHKALAEDICKTNGTTLSAVVRKTIEAIVRDYLPSGNRRE